MAQRYDKKNNSPNDTLKKQQWAKSLSQYFVMKMLKLCPDSKLYSSYFNSTKCTSTKLYTMDENGKGKLTSTYCKNRWCYVCNRIRTAININHYLPQLNQFGNPFFVTLTLPTCTADELKDRIDHFLKAWRNIYKRSFNGDKLKEVAEKNIKLNGVRSIECTLRPEGKYHLHMHLIIDGWHNAEWVVKQWLKLHPEANKLAQDIRNIYVSNEAEPLNVGGLMEVFKYAIKMTTSAKKDEDFPRMNIVFETFKGRRLLSAFGSVKALCLTEQNEDELMDLAAQTCEDLEVRFGNEVKSFTWQPDVYDWVDRKSGEMLVGMPIPTRIERIVKGSEEMTTLPKTAKATRKKYKK